MPALPEDTLTRGGRRGLGLAPWNARDLTLSTMPFEGVRSASVPASRPHQKRTVDRFLQVFVQHN